MYHISLKLNVVWRLMKNTDSHYIMHYVVVFNLKF